MVNSIWFVLGLAALPAAGNFCGGMLAEFFGVPKARLNKALHAASGIVIAVVAVELMPEALSKISGWTIGLAFGLGSLAYIGIETTMERVLQGDSGNAGNSRIGMWMIYMAVSMDLFSDGLLIGTGSTVSTSMAIVLALGQVLADVPEGYATIANMKSKGIPRSRRIMLSASFTIPVLAAAAVAYYLLRNQSEVWQMGALAFVAGLLTVAAVEDMISEAHETEDTRGSVVAFSGGFIIFTFVSAGLGS
jgi:ZIP family zinc transporter